MNTLLPLKDILQKLKKKEITSLINFLKSHRKESNEHAMKSIQLIKLIIKNNGYSSDQLQKTIYGKNNYHAFNKLVNRLKERIYEIILFDNNITQSEVYDKRNLTVFAIRKKLLQVEIMTLRGMNYEIEKFHKNIIHISKEYEMYGTLLETLYAKQRYLGFRYGKKVVQKLNKEIEYFENVRIIDKNSRKIFNNINANISISDSSCDYQNELKEAISVLQKNYDQTKSATILFYLLFLKTEHYQINHEFQNAKKILIQMKGLLENNNATYTKNRMGTILLNIVNNELLMFNFIKCLVDSKVINEYFSNNPVNNAINYELLFYTYFYTNKIDKAEKIIEELYHASRTAKTPFQNSKRAYLLACIKTFTGKYLDSNELLKEVKEIEKDREGWGIGVRILVVMNSIEMGNDEKADRDIDKLKKHSMGASARKTIRKRNILIQEVLVHLKESNYEFLKTLKSKSRIFRLLESNQVDCRWKIKSPELIIFHEWFKQKAEGRPYNHVAAIQNAKERYLMTVKNESL